MPKNRAIPLSTVSFSIEEVQPDLMEGEQPNSEGARFRLSMAVDGKPLNVSDSDLATVDGLDVWLGQRYDAEISPLTCTCGVPECAGFNDKVRCQRKGGRISWVFPKSYFTYLQERGLADGRARPITLQFNASAFYSQFEQVLEQMRHFEQVTGKRAAFDIIGEGTPVFPLDEQLSRTREWHLHQHPGRRFSRHQGVPAGRCAGKPTR